MTELRQHYLTLRQQIPATERTAAEKKIAEQLYQLPEFNNSEHIACYQSFAGEVSTDAIIKTILAANKTCYLPIVKDDSTLQFAKFDNAKQLAKSDHGMLEPIAPYQLITAEQLDLVITPLIAFDPHCNRMGWGKGCYDRTFAFLNKTPRPTKPFLIGLAFQLQHVVELNPEPHDVKLNAVVTEEEVVKC